jgi:hypothetical protein
MGPWVWPLIGKQILALTDAYAQRAKGLFALDRF